MPLKPEMVGRFGKKRAIVRLASGPGGKQLVSRLVMFAFGPPSPGDGYIVAHDNGNELDNRPSNLMWKTYKENSADRIRHGTDMRGSQCKQSILTEDQIREIFNTPPVRGYITALAKRFGVNRTTVSKVVAGINWAHLKPPR
jgi:hypothetical protein